MNRENVRKILYATTTNEYNIFACIENLIYGVNVCNENERKSQLF